MRIYYCCYLNVVAIVIVAVDSFVIVLLKVVDALLKIVSITI